MPIALVMGLFLLLLKIGDYENKIYMYYTNTTFFYK
jgi:hypothetical protein